VTTKPLVTLPSLEKLRCAALSAEVKLRLQLAYEATRSVVVMKATVDWDAARTVYGEDDSRTQAAKRRAVALGEALAGELDVGERTLAETEEAMRKAKVAELSLRQLN
jgi:hypothetical protein